MKSRLGMRYWTDEARFKIWWMKWKGKERRIKNYKIKAALQDWISMLERMEENWINKKGYEATNKVKWQIMMPEWDHKNHRRQRRRMTWWPWSNPDGEDAHPSVQNDGLRVRKKACDWLGPNALLIILPVCSVQQQHEEVSLAKRGKLRQTKRLQHK